MVDRWRTAIHRVDRGGRGCDVLRFNVDSRFYGGRLAERSLAETGAGSLRMCRAGVRVRIGNAHHVPDLLGATGRAISRILPIRRTLIGIQHDPLHCLVVHVPLRLWHPPCTGSLDWEVGFTPQQISINWGSTLGPTAYDYNDVIEVKTSNVFIAPNGKRVNRWKGVIELRDGTRWSTHDSPDDLDTQDFRRLFELVAERAGVEIQNVPAFARGDL